MSGWSWEVVALGANYSWITVAKGEIIFQGTEGEYPKLRLRDYGEKETASYYGKIRRLVLGERGHFLVQGEKNHDWSLDQSLVDYIWVDHGSIDNIRVFTLGQNGSYIVSFSNGDLTWSLAGHYAGLENWLKSQNPAHLSRVRSVVLARSCLQHSH